MLCLDIEDGTRTEMIAYVLNTEFMQGWLSYGDYMDMFGSGVFDKNEYVGVGNIYPIPFGWDGCPMSVELTERMAVVPSFCEIITINNRLPLDIKAYRDMDTGKVKMNKHGENVSDLPTGDMISDIYTSEIYASYNKQVFKNREEYRKYVNAKEHNRELYKRIYISIHQQLSDGKTVLEFGDKKYELITITKLEELLNIEGVA